MSVTTIQTLKYEFAPLNGAGDTSHEETRRELAEAEIEAIRAAAFAEGEARGRALAESGIERQQTDALATIASSVGRLADHFAASHAALEAGAGALALAIGRAIAGAAIARAPIAAIRPLVREALEALTDDARVIIEVNEAIVAIVEEQVAEAAEDAGFTGRIRVRAGADNISDCRIDWGDGGIERRVADITHEIADRLAAHGIVLPPARFAAAEE